MYDFVHFLVNLNFFPFQHRSAEDRIHSGFHIDPQVEGPILVLQDLEPGFLVFFSFLNFTYEQTTLIILHDAFHRIVP